MREDTWQFDDNIGRWYGPPHWHGLDRPGAWKTVLSEDGTRAVLEPKFSPVVGQWVRFNGQAHKVLRVSGLAADLFDAPFYVPFSELTPVPDEEGAARDYWGEMWVES